MDTSNPAFYPPFESFKPIPRYARPCVITEKIDGMNAQIYIDEPSGLINGGVSRVFAGSRNRWLGLEKSEDAFGFARWVKEHEDELRTGLGPGRHFGEWWGAGIQRGYGLGERGGQEKRFSLFNTGRWNAETKPACCHVVPVLWEGEFGSVWSYSAVTDSMDRLAKWGSVAAPGFMKPEGIVIFHVAANVAFKKTIGDDGHKGDRR